MVSLYNGTICSSKRMRKLTVYLQDILQNSKAQNNTLEKEEKNPQNITNLKTSICLIYYPGKEVTVCSYFPPSAYK
jgi:C4-type Zn-finger protein